VAAAALGNGIRAGILASNAADAARHRSNGFEFIAIASDAVLLASAGHRALAEVRARTAGPLIPTTLG
jgi:2-keto-3-deoxy-L-rhamnonate aldolase RhmA